MPFLRMLFVDDEPETVRPAIKSVESDFKTRVTNFANFRTTLSDFLPHIVIIDKIEGVPPGGKAEGTAVFDFIWKERFCPIIIYSAYPEEGEDDREKHPLVKFVTKGAEIRGFLDSVNILRPFIDALLETEIFFSQQFAITLRDVAPTFVKVYEDPAQLKDAILRSSRRRFAAFMDDQVRLGGPLSSWEHYLYPPVSEDIQLGDILRLAGGNIENPDEFRVVLTPSCDMVASGGRTPKVNPILSAFCCSTQEGLKLCGFGEMKKGNLEERLPNTMLTPGFYYSVIPFPALKGSMPAFMVNLRKLEFIKLEQIEPKGRQYVRVASIDSPFRELVAWAYLSVACRPGLPERDFVTWAKQISDEVFPEK